MLIDYINKELSKAEYDKHEDGSFSGTIPQCPGVMAFGNTLFECQKELGNNKRNKGLTIYMTNIR